MANEIRLEDLLENPNIDTTKVDTSGYGHPHMPLIILIDVSQSMETDNKLQQVEKFLIELFNRVHLPSENDDVFKKVRDQVDFCVITYGTEVEIAMDWTHGSRLDPDINIEPAGVTSMCTAVIEAGNQLLKCFKRYKEDDIPPLCGCVFNLTDGLPTDGAPNSDDPTMKKNWEQARKIIDFWETAGSKGNAYANFIHFGVGKYDKQLLQALAGVGRSERVYSIESNKDVGDFFGFIGATLENLGKYPTPAEAIAEAMEDRAV